MEGAAPYRRKLKGRLRTLGVAVLSVEYAPMVRGGLATGGVAKATVGYSRTAQWSEFPTRRNPRSYMILKARRFSISNVSTTMTAVICGGADALTERGQCFHYYDCGAR